MDAIKPQLKPSALDGPRIGAIAHLYRGEIYRSTIWRTRLDNTTNWAVVTLGIALSVTFSSAEASPLPLLLTGVLCIVFLMFEARRYRYFNVWRARARWLERNFYAPMLRGEDLKSTLNGRGFLPTIIASRSITSALPAPSVVGCAVIIFGSSGSKRLLTTARSRFTRCRYRASRSWSSVPVSVQSRAS